MKFKKIKNISIITVVTIISLMVWNISGAIYNAFKITAAASTYAVIPGGLSLWFSKDLSEQKQYIKKEQESNVDQKSEPETPALTKERPTDVETGDIKTTKLSASSANTEIQGIHIDNKTGKTVDFSDLLEQGLPFHLEKTDQPQVLIYHTHATESYTSDDYGYYLKSDSSRTTDTSRNTIRVGKAIADILNSNGIVTINDETLHDAKAYTGSYDRSANTVKDYLEKYPTIKVIIDGHRDAITQNNGTKIKPTVEINGKNAAQIMILSGCESGDITNFPNWKENLRVNLQLQKQIENDYPGLARAMSFKSCKYNFDIMNGSMLIEIGSEANTLEEAIYSGELIGNALVKILS